MPTPITDDNEFNEGDASEEFDPEILRKYEQGKLKWFFAVVDCDSIKTAAHIYKECDGLEFERSGIVLDVRYIPDDVEFSQAPRDTATAVTLNYKAPLFSNKATSSSKVELTWDRDDPERFKLRKKKFTKDEINDIDLQAYLDSESDDEEDEDEKEKRHKGRDKLRALLGEGGNDRGDSNSDGDSDGSDESESEQEDMVITFDGGLRDVGKDILEKKKKRDLEAKETTWESYLRKRAEKKAAKKAARKKSAQHNRSGGATAGEQQEDLGFDDPFFQTQDDDTAVKDKRKNTQKTDDPFDDPFFNTAGDDADGDVDAALVEMESKGKKKGKEKKNDKTKKKKSKATAEEQRTGTGDDDDDDPIAKAQKARERAELELMVGGTDEREDERENSFNMKHVGTKKKNKKKNRSKRKQMEEDDDSDAPEDGDDGFRIDTADDRFAAIFESQKFAIDPNDPKFKKTPAMEKVMEERQERRKKKRRQEQKEPASSRSAKDTGLDGTHGKKKHKKVKSKHGKDQDLAQLVASVKRKAS
eukprot:COSAG02_NODE_95_length_37416_cov_60.512742_34_plen_530_part_00